MNARKYKRRHYTRFFMGKIITDERWWNALFELKYDYKWMVN